MVAFARSATDARLFPHRGRGGPSLLAVPRRIVCARNRTPPLVHAWAVRMTAAPRYAELAITTNFSFLRGASHPQEFAQQATLHGLAAIGIADRNTLAGVVRAYDALEQLPGEKPKLVVGARLAFADGTPDILAYPTDRAAYGLLSQMLSRGKHRAKKGEGIVYFNDLLEFEE